MKWKEFATNEISYCWKRRRRRQQKVVDLNVEEDRTYCHEVDVVEESTVFSERSERVSVSTVDPVD